MKKTVISFLIFGLYLVNIFSGDDVLIKIHDREVTKDEFLRIYNKNNNSNTIDNKSIDEYLDLFINFKLKVIEAEELGYDTMSSFINEFEQYRKQLVKPYFIDKEAEEQLVKETYERMKYEISASHILIKVSEKASPEDTAMAYQKITEIRQRIINGEDFGEVAKATSDDQSAKSNNGYLGYFTAFSMVYPFENAAYNTPVGEISMPFRTSFGYHIVKVNDKRPAQGEIKVAHIMKMTPRGSTDEFTDSLKNEIYKIYERIKSGEDFAELAKSLSDDKSSGRKGGELPWFKPTDRIVEEFVSACFAIKNNGDITEPFQSPFGWHIVKRIDKKEIKAYEDIKDEIKEKIKRDSRRNIISEEVAVEKLKNEYNFTENKDNLEYIKTVINDDIFKKGWKAELCMNDEILFSLDGINYTQKDFAQYLEKNQKSTSPYDISVYVTENYKNFVKQCIFDYEESKLDEKYPDYKYLVQEYHDGILLFNLTDEMVWSKAVKDTFGLKEFYEKNKINYMWDNRANVTVYSSSDPEKIKELRKIVKKGEFKNSEVIKLLCDTINPYCVSYNQDLFLKGENEFVDKTNWKTGVSKVMNKDDKYYVVQLFEIVPEQPKKFEEAAGLITSDYQNYLDKEWVSELRNKYEIVVNSELLSSLK